MAEEERRERGSSCPMVWLGCWLVALTSLVHPGETASVDLTCSDFAARPAGAALPRLPFAQGWCCEDTEYGQYGTVIWPETPAAHFVSIDCPYGPREGTPAHGVAKAQRRCKMHLSVGAVWLASDYSQCRKQGTPEEAAAKDAEDAVIMTEDPDAITADTFQKAVELVTSASTLALTNRTVARSMLKAMSNLVAARPSVQREGDKDGSRRRSLFRVLDEHARGVQVMSDEGRYDEAFENLHLSVTAVTSGHAYGEEIRFESAYDGHDDRVAVGMPVEAIQVARDGSEDPAAKYGELRVRFVAVRNALLLDPPGVRSSQQQVVNVAISLAPDRSDLNLGAVKEQPSGDLSVQNLKTPVRIEMPFSTWGATHICAYLDENDGEWKRDGVTYQQGAGSGMSTATCESTHLTPFTLLLDPSPRRSLEGVQVALDVIGYLGSTLSVLCLIVTIITYQFFSRFGQDRWGRVLVQLCASLLLLHLSYLATNLKGVIPPGCCVAIAVLVHLTLLSSFCWMLVEALLMYQLLITVFQDAHTKFILKRLFFAWGTPILVVVVCASVDPKYYLDTHPDFCLTSAQNELQHGLVTLLPCCLILVVNVVIFVRISVVLLRRRTPPGLRTADSEPGPVTWAQVRGVVGVAFLLGITWVLSPLAMRNPTLLVVSSVLNASQGVAIFVSRVLTHPEARRTWRHRIFPKADLRSSSASYPVSEKISVDISRSSESGRFEKKGPSSVESRRISFQNKDTTVSDEREGETPRERGSGYDGVLLAGRWLPRLSLTRPVGGKTVSQPPEAAAPVHPKPPQKQTICKRRSQLFQQLYVE